MGIVDTSNFGISLLEDVRDRKYAMGVHEKGKKFGRSKTYISFSKEIDLHTIGEPISELQNKDMKNEKTKYCKSVCVQNLFLAEGTIELEPSEGETRRSKYQPKCRYCGVVGHIAKICEKKKTRNLKG